MLNDKEVDEQRTPCAVMVTDKDGKPVAIYGPKPAETEKPPWKKPRTEDAPQPAASSSTAREPTQMEVEPAAEGAPAEAAREALPRAGDGDSPEAVHIGEEIDELALAAAAPPRPHDIHAWAGIHPWAHGDVGRRLLVTWVPKRWWVKVALNVPEGCIVDDVKWYMQELSGARSSQMRMVRKRDTSHISREENVFQNTHDGDEVIMMPLM